MALPLRDAVALVTGAGGFIGSHLVRRLLDEGCEVHGIVRPHTSHARLAGLEDRLHLAPVDLTDSTSVDACIGRVRPDCVFHLAGITSSRASVHGASVDLFKNTYDVNVTATRELLTSLLRHRSPLRIVRTGGIEEYGAGPAPYREDQREQPVSSYGASQVAATHLCSVLHRQTGLPIVTVRPALVYGPRQSETFFIPALIDACLAGRPFAMTDGRQTRDLVFVADVVDGMVRAAVAPGIDGEIINLSSGYDYRLLDVAHMVVRLAASTTRLDVGAVSRRPNDLDRLVCDPARAGRLLGWKAVTPLAEGLSACLASARTASAVN